MLKENWARVWTPPTTPCAHSSKQPLVKSYTKAVRGDAWYLLVRARFWSRKVEEQEKREKREKSKSQKVEKLLFFLLFAFFAAKSRKMRKVRKVKK